MVLRTDKIENERKRLGYTKRAFSEFLGIHETTYHTIIRKKTTTFNGISRIAEKLGFDPKDLLTQ